MMVVEIPERFWLGHGYNTTLYAPIQNWQDYNSSEYREYLNPTGRRTVMGYVVPDFQRPLVWSEEQSIQFIESIWMGLPLGTYTTNVDPNINRFKPEHRNLIIDGQQRLFAIQQYLEDRFEVFGGRWSEVTSLDQRRFGMTTFASYETSSDDGDYIRDYYNRMNFGGVAHTEEQRA